MTNHKSHKNAMSLTDILRYTNDKYNVPHKSYIGVGIWIGIGIQRSKLHLTEGPGGGPLLQYV